MDNHFNVSKLRCVDVFCLSNFMTGAELEVEWRAAIGMELLL